MVVLVCDSTSQELLEQAEYVGAALVSLRQHGLCSLEKNIVL
ncbi:hypothetical protein SAMN02745671_01847, partial [Anaerovibrio lipolyticus DSM 3074]